ncbi:hypothetical protein LUZ61_011777 [Rhynchospora tenuis]|uniref:Uncharacterized protein n=1 Tax=Rhynchospora tenuis TaxID=198213 RepID=A0AAD6F0H6_9POAL|nr:hypothetical protein LUZ61_011777 [Rhynchospora tenuis]
MQSQLKKHKHYFSMAFVPSALLSTCNNTPLDEQKWVNLVRSTFDVTEEEESHVTQIPVSVFAVPKVLTASKPEAYSPQLFALGPYHHWNAQLYEMEQYKLITAKLAQRRFKQVRLQNVVDEFAMHEHMIRSYYHRHLQMNADTLAWMMAIDTCFLSEFLQNYATKHPPRKATRTMSHMVDCKKMKLCYNTILKDIFMLENQIPLFLVRSIFHYQYRSMEHADDELSKMLSGLLNEISPFKEIKNCMSAADILHRAHLLELLYYTIIPDFKEIILDTSYVEIINNDHRDEIEEQESDLNNDKKQVKELISLIFSLVSRLKGVPSHLAKKIFKSRPINFITKIPWFFVASTIKSSAEKIIEGGSNQMEEHGDENSQYKPPLAAEITIPSVSDLSRAGVQFAPVEGGLTRINFDPKTFTLYLPVVSLDSYSDVVLRNLVAYEASIVWGPLIFARFIEFMNGIIDTEEDVRILCKMGILENRMKSDCEAADLWNGMNRSLRLTKVPFLDSVIDDVNKFYDDIWSVKCRRLMKKYVFSSWQILIFLATILLLALSCIQAFCSVYKCNPVLSSLQDE